MILVLYARTLHLLFPLSSILTILGPDPEAIKSTCAEFPVLSMNAGSGPYAKAEMDFPMAVFLVTLRNLLVRDEFILLW